MLITPICINSESSTVVPDEQRIDSLLPGLHSDSLLPNVCVKSPHLTVCVDSLLQSLRVDCLRSILSVVSLLLNLSVASLHLNLSVASLHLRVDSLFQNMCVDSSFPCLRADARFMMTMHSLDGGTDGFTVISIAVALLQVSSRQLCACYTRNPNLRRMVDRQSYRLMFTSSTQADEGI